MSWKQVNLDKTTILGNGEISRVYIPYIMSGIRRSNPDMSSISAYYPSLNTKTVIIEQGGDYSATTTITFSSDFYSLAINAINTVSPTHIKAIDSDGYIGFSSQHSGGNNYIKITGGTALSILGIEPYPHPAGISYAGEIDTPKPNIFENRTKNTGVVLKNEALTRENWNRGLAAVTYALDSVSSNLDREISFPVQYTTTISGTSFSIASADRLNITANGINSAIPTADDLDKIITVVDMDNNLLFDSNGDRVRVNSVTYGASITPTLSFAAWNTADGKSIFGNTAHTQKVKTTSTITSVMGNTIRCSGAAFSTLKIQPNDVVKITGATNLNPFSHNGEFIVDQILSEEIMQIRPRGTMDGVLTTGQTPSSLNTYKGLGEVYGAVTVYVGKFLPLTMPNGNMVFNLSASLPSSSYKVIMSVGKSLKNLLQEDISASTINHPNGGQLEVGSKLFTTLANALKPRIIAHPNNDTTKTLFSEFKNGTIGSRIYILKAGGMEFVYNGVWNGATYIKEDMTKDVVVIKEDVATVFLGTDIISLNIDYVNGDISLGTALNKFVVSESTGVLKAHVETSFSINDGTLDVLTVPIFDGTSASNSSLKAGLNVGTGFSTDNQHLIEKINYTCNTGTSKYTLLNETVLTNVRKREYVTADGTSITTINAKWDGTQWIKDYATTSSKLVLTIVDSTTTLGDNVIHYSHNSNTTPFADSVWTNKDEIKTFQLNEDFLENVLLSSVINDRLGTYFSVSSILNTVIFSYQTNAGYIGELEFQPFAAGAFSASAVVTPLYVGTADFEMRVRINVQRYTLLSAIDTSFANGLIVGHNTGSSDNLTFKVGLGGTWHSQIGTHLIDSLVTCTTDCLLVMSRINGVVNAFINGALVDSRAFASSVIFIPQISMKGTAVMAAESIFNIDFFKLWVGGINK